MSIDWIHLNKLDTDICLTKAAYTNGNLAIQAWCREDFEPWATVSVNLDYLVKPETTAFLDVNNLGVYGQLDDIAAYLESSGIGHDTGHRGMSGFVTNYPLFEFDPSRLMTLDEALAEYEKEKAAERNPLAAKKEQAAAVNAARGEVGGRDGKDEPEI